MASEKIIKRRIKSAKNISQITRAMQMVAASKMKKAQNAAFSSRPYADKITQMVSDFIVQVDPEKHPLLDINIQGKTLLILISTNKGLCGGLNTNLFRYLTKFIHDQQLSDMVYVTLGKKGEQFIIRSAKQLLADFSSSVNSIESVPALVKMIVDGYLKTEYREVYLLYNNFISGLKQEPTFRKILPLSQLISPSLSDLKEPKKSLFIIEPSIDQILDGLLQHYLENQVRDAILQSLACEHSARMLAMKNATDNAVELMQLLTLEFNKARQAKITYEIADMVTARIAVK